jgi:hypothetical protein
VDWLFPVTPFTVPDVPDAEIEEPGFALEPSEIIRCRQRSSSEAAGREPD